MDGIRSGGGKQMTESQKIKLNRIIKKLEDAKKELKGLIEDQTFPLNSAERANMIDARKSINDALYSL